jgi:hypothetical protein
MKRLASFAVGFVTGWLARSAVDSSREAFVQLGALGYSTLGRLRRIVALERERMDDFVAEARARAGAHLRERAPETKGDGAAGREHEHVA